MSDDLASILEDLTGQKPPMEPQPPIDTSSLWEGSGLGHSQFNELLLLHGFSTVSDTFFQFLINGATDVQPHAAIESLNALRDGVDRFRKLAMLRFGSISTGFKYLSKPSTNLSDEIAVVTPIDPKTYEQRHDPLVPLEQIPGDKTYFLGFLIKKHLDERLAARPDDAGVKAQLEERERFVKMGKHNHAAYLASDHLDVYVATSMRERHEYLAVNEIVREVAESPQLSNLKLRFFDPTQAYCEDRIDKGLAEGLMLKRATCTLYLAQESDTLGKDSELASTLAQGKPVIAYIPRVSESDAADYVDKLIEAVKAGQPGVGDHELVLQQLQVFEPAAAWADEEVRKWASDPSKMSVVTTKARLAKSIRQHYERRANTLKESHPLGMQVHLETGVSHGVLVARSTEQCAELIRRIMTQTLEFEIREKEIGGCRYLLLREKITDSIFRVVTGDSFLTNAFWNFYLPK